MKYRKKPVVIDAAQYTGPNAFDVGRELGMEFGQPPHDKKDAAFTDSGTMVIHTLEGDHYVSVGDFIIKGVAGEFYACKPDIFEQTYELE